MAKTKEEKNYCEFCGASEGMGGFHSADGCFDNEDVQTKNGIPVFTVKPSEAKRG